LCLAHNIDKNGSQHDCGADVDWNFLPSWQSMQQFTTLIGVSHLVAVLCQRYTVKCRFISS